MIDRVDEREKGMFGFRYRLLPQGRLAVWYRFGEQHEVGPVELERAAADELGALLERASQLVTRGRPSAYDPELAAPPAPRKADEDSVGGTPTDPPGRPGKRPPPAQET